MKRCCENTKRFQIDTLHGPYVEGTEVPCMEVCDNLWRFQDGHWQLRDSLAQTITKMVDGLPAVKARLAAERAARLERERV